MNRYVFEISSRFSEGILHQTPFENVPETNLFHRNITFHQSSDISFITGFMVSGLRGSVLIDGNRLLDNIQQLGNARRFLIPLVINTNARNADGTDNYEAISIISNIGCFQFMASSPLEEVYLTLIAHRIAELSLIPGMVIADYQQSKSDIKIPTDEVIMQYLGNPDDHIICPTPSQEIIFGRTRRRIPNWYSFELPATIGSKKDGKELYFEKAAYQKYIVSHLPDLISQAFREFNELTHLNIAPLTSQGKGKQTIISIGGSSNYELENALSANKKLNWIQLSQINPLPADQLSELLKKKDSVSILEPLGNYDGQAGTISMRLNDALSSSKTPVRTISYSSADALPNLNDVVDRLNKEKQSSNIFLNLPLLKRNNNYPKQEVLVNEIEKNYPDIENDVIITDGRSMPSAQSALPLSFMVRNFKDKGPDYSKLSRFYDQVGIFYRSGNEEEVIADPFSAVPLLPASSANLLSSERKVIPVFDSAKCTGCGDCFIHCPHSAIPPLAISVEQLIQSGVSIAISKGKTVSKLIPMIKNISQIASGILSKKEINSNPEFLDAAFDDLVKRMNLEGEKLETVRNEYQAVMEEIGAMPLSVNETFFHKPNTIEKGKGELFTLAVDPYSCTGCGICSQVCDEDALEMVDTSISLEEKTFSNYTLWENLPDTHGDTILRYYKDPEYPSLAAILLSRNYYMTLSGAARSDKHAPSRTLLHIIGAAAEAIAQPRILNEIEKIESYVKVLTEAIHQNLSDAIPDQDLESIAHSLRKARRKKIRINDIIDNVEDEQSSKFLDAEVLQRKADLAMDLNHLKDILTSGPTGYGRSRYGFVVTSENTPEFIGDYPYNNFSTPVIIHHNLGSSDLVRGLFKAQARIVLDHIKLIRRAELEQSNKYDPGIHDIQIARLSWEQLSEEEKLLVPPLILVTSTANWDSSYDQMVAQGYPLKIVNLETLKISPVDPLGSLSSIYNKTTRYLGLNDIYIYQGGMENTEMLLQGLMDGLAKAGPALFNIFSMDFGDHDIGCQDSTPYAKLAHESRMFPTLCYSPSPSSSFLNKTLNLQSNKNIQDEWITENVKLSDDQMLKYSITPADWLFTVRSWKDQFQEIQTHEDHIPLADYLTLNTEDRKGKAAYITRSGLDGIRYFSVNNKVVLICDQALSNWNKLRELAGVLTEFPDKLSSMIRKEIKGEFEDKERAMQEEFKKKVLEIESSQKEELRQKLKEKLVVLSKMKRNNVKS